MNSTSPLAIDAPTEIVVMAGLRTRESVSG